MPIPQYSVNSKFDKDGWDVVRQDIAALCRNVNGKASKISFDSTSRIESENVQDAIEELDADFRDRLDVYVQDYGAAADGVTDDTSSVQAAINACPEGGRVIFKAGAGYYLTSLGTISKGITIDGRGCRVTCDITPTGVTGTPLFCFSGSKGTAYAVSAISEGNITVTCTTIGDAANFAAGDTVYITCSDAVNKWDSSGTVSVPKIEVNSVTSVDTGTGVITLAFPMSYSMSTSPTVAKLATVIAPAVINFANITEVDPGAPYVGGSYGGPTTPNIVDFTYCVLPKAENIVVTGWNVQICSMEFCLGGNQALLRGERPYNPGTGGTGNVARVGWSRGITVSRCQGLRVRHLLDYYGALDCVDEYCVSTTDPDDVTAAAYITHGYLSKRIKSFCSSSYNGQGWSVGNSSYAADSDVFIVGFTYKGGDTSLAANAITVGYGATNVVIESCNISSYTGGPRLIGVADNVRFNNCIIINLGAAESAFHAYSSSSIYPSNVYITNSTITSGSTNPAIAIQADVQGDLTIDGCVLSANVPIYLSEFAATTNLRITRNTITALGTPSYAVGVNTAGGLAPTGIYEVSDNVISGATSTAAIVLAGATNLKLYGNRYADTANKYSITGATNIAAIIAAGGCVEDNLSASDRPSSLNSYEVTAAAGTTKGFFASSAGVWRWAFAANNVAESGSNVGSDLEIRSYTDAGAYQDAPVYISRQSGGSMQLTRPTLYIGSSGLASDVQEIFRSATGRNRGLTWQTGTSDRWRLRVNNTAESGANAGSNFEILAYTDAAANIDTTLSIARVAGGTIAFSSARPITSGQVTATSSSGITTLQAATQDAMRLLGRAGGTSSYIGTLTPTTLTASRTWTFPDAAIVVSGSASALTATHIPYVTTGGLLTSSSALTYDNSAFTLSLGAASAIAPIFILNANAGTVRDIRIHTAGVLRWAIRGSGDAESGSDAGTALQILARNDAGGAIDTPLSITRAAGGLISITRPITTTGVVTVPNGTSASPGLRLTSEASGLYRVSSTSLGFSVAGTASASLTSAGNFNAVGSLTTTSATAGVGYATGAGGTVTQITSRTTGVTINKVCGQITLVSAAGSATWQSFTVTNSAVATTDVVTVCQDSGTDKYMIHVTAVGAGSFEITYATTGGTTTEQPVFNFAVIKAVTA